MIPSQLARFAANDSQPSHESSHSTKSLLRFVLSNSQLISFKQLRGPSERFDFLNKLITIHHFCIIPPMSCLCCRQTKCLNNNSNLDEVRNTRGSIQYAAADFHLRFTMDSKHWATNLVVARCDVEVFDHVRLHSLTNFVDVNAAVSHLKCLVKERSCHLRATPWVMHTGAKGCVKNHTQNFECHVCPVQNGPWLQNVMDLVLGQHNIERSVGLPCLCRANEICTPS